MATSSGARSVQAAAHIPSHPAVIAMRSIPYGALEAAAFLTSLALIGSGAGILWQLCRG